MRPSQPVTVKRRVSRVESLRNLLFNRGGPHAAHLDAKKMMMKKRARSAEKDKATEKVTSKHKQIAVKIMVIVKALPLIRELLIPRFAH